MHSRNIPLFFIVASLTSTSLGLHPPSLAITARRSFNLARQAESPQLKCDDTCNAFHLSADPCIATSSSCLCTTANSNMLQDCTNCRIAVAGTNTSLISTALQLGENGVTQFNFACSGVEGLPTLTVPAFTVNTKTGAPESTPTATTAAALPSTTGPASGSTSTCLSTKTGDALGSLSTGPGA